MGLTKGFLINCDTKEQINFLFNPTEYTVAKSNSWEQKRVVGKNVPKTAFTGGGPRTMTMDLFFDVFEIENGDVRTHTDQLWKLCMINAGTENPNTQRSDPPYCIFQWGPNWHFKAAVTTLSVRFTLFREDGTPVRATANITLQDVEDNTVQLGTNPTSESEPGRKRREVRPHDTLATIAYEEYGSPNHWRLIARANAVDDPFSLQPGEVLAIPPLQ